MKFLVDQNISFRIIKALQPTFEIEHINDLTLKDKSDKEIWEFAKTNEYCIVTFDGDFYDFSLVWGHPPKIVWIRTYNQTTKNVVALITNHQQAIYDFSLNKGLACLEIIDK